MSMMLRMAGTLGQRRVPFFGLLDLHPGAAACYPLRVVKAADINEPLLRVRRDSDNDEINVKADLSAMVNGNYFLSMNSGLVGSGASFADFMGSANGFVRTWYDQSGNARHAEQATAGNQPQIVAGGALYTIGGKPRVRFDADAHTMSFSSITPTSLWWVAQTTAITKAIHYLLWNGTNLSDARGMYQAGSAVGVNGLGVFDGTLKSITSTETARLLASIYYNGTAYEAAVNAGSATAFTAGSQFDVSHIGRGIPPSDVNLSIGGHIEELLMYTSNQSANRTAIESNINAAWGVF